MNASPIAFVARLALLLGLSLPALAQDNVAGTWEHKDAATGVTIVFTLNPDGSARIDDEAAKYTVQGNTISVVIDGETIRYTYKIEGDTMTVSGGDLDKPTAFTRKGGAAPKRGLGAKIKGGSGENKPNPFEVAGAQTGEAKPMEKPAAPTLLGRWQAEDGSEISFTQDQFTFGGRDVPYKAVDGKITLSGPKGEIQWPYGLSGDQLILTLEGQKQTLKRVGAAPVIAAGESPRADDKKPAAPANTPFGTWAADDGDKLEIRADAIVYQGASIQAQDTGKAIRVTVNGQSMDWPYSVSGDTMRMTVGEQVLSLKRVGAAPVNAGVKKDAGADAGAAAGNAPANNDPKSLVGMWDGPDGTAIVRADGTMRSGGQDFKWQADATHITLADDKQWVKVPYKLDGDKLVLGEGQTKTLTRNKGGLAGVWVAQEAQLNERFYMGITQYLSLYPDGNVGFAKTESAANRTQISEQLERFRSWRENQGGGGKTYGKWQQNGDTVTIQWQGAFGNKAWQGQINPKNGKLVIRGAGILVEGDTLEYERQ